jgi:hypothetical protein
VAKAAIAHYTPYLAQDVGPFGITWQEAFDPASHHGEDSRYAPVLEPSRKSLTSGASLGQFVRGQLALSRI